MDPATLIAFISLVVAVLAFATSLPGAIDATLNVISKYRALKKDAQARPALNSPKAAPRVGVIGVGAVGSAFVRELAAKVGSVMLIDPDQVEVRNLNRMIPLKKI